MSADARKDDDVDEPAVAANGADDDEPRRLHRVRHRARSHRVVGPFYKIAVFVVGMCVVAAGLAMLVLPGPGWVAIILGLVILASEFTWAERLLEPIKELAERMAERALDPKKRRQNLLFLAALAVLAVIVAWAYYARYGLTYEPVPFL